MNIAELPVDEVKDFHQHLMLWYALAEKFLYPDPTSEFALAGRLKHWREIKTHLKRWKEVDQSNLPPEVEATLPPEYFVKNPHLEAVEAFQAEILQAFHDLNTPYLRRLWRAVDHLSRPKKGAKDKPKRAVSPTLTGVALLAQKELRKKLNRYPSPCEVHDLVKSWRGEFSNRQWRRVLKNIDGLFPKRLSKVVKQLDIS